MNFNLSLSVSENENTENLCKLVQQSCEDWNLVNPAVSSMYQIILNKWNIVLISLHKKFRPEDFDTNTTKKYVFDA